MYNPLAHWDYFADTHTSAFVPLDPMIGGGTRDVTTSETRGQATNMDRAIPDVYNGETMSAHRFQLAILQKKEMRKTKLRSIIAHSELSFVVSLLSSSWSKSCLHTRALTYASMTDQLDDTMWNVSNTSHTDTNSSSIRNGQNLIIHPTSQRTLKSLSLVWRPCCGLYKISDDPTWKCHTCGFSSALHEARFPRHQQEVSSFDPSDCSSSISSINDLIDMISNIQTDSTLSDNYSFDGQVSDIHEVDESSATLEYLETRLQSMVYEENQEIQTTTIDNWDSSQLNATDHFGNTALHHAAAGRNFDAILMLLINDIPPQALNTHGQTFLHLLDVQGDFERYLDVLRQLKCKTTSFPFSHKDHYGTTIASRFSLSAEITGHTSREILSEIYSLSGNEHLLLEENGSLPTDLDFGVRCDALPVEDWASGDSDIAIEIDRHGDTCLIAILKRWSFDRCQKNLVALIDKLATDRELKADVNAYDKEGKTPLSIAASKGLYSAVDRLLHLEANPNTMTPFWAGESVLQIAKSSLKAARKANKDKLYTAILQCEKRLVKSRPEVHATAPPKYSIALTPAEQKAFARQQSLRIVNFKNEGDLWNEYQRVSDIWRLCLNPLS